jgi:hypothetical protein
MHLGSQSYLLAELYEQGLTLEQAAQRNVAPLIDFEPLPEIEVAEPVAEVGADAEAEAGVYVEAPDEAEAGLEEGGMAELALDADALAPDSLPASVPDALSLTGGQEVEEE